MNRIIKFISRIFGLRPKKKKKKDATIYPMF